jgi:hypothetical protein
MRYRLRTLLIVLALGPPVLTPALTEGWKRYRWWRNGGGSDKLKQIGIGLHNYHGDSVLLQPPPTVWAKRSTTTELSK